MDTEKYAWVKASTYRENLLLAMAEKPRTPKELSGMTEYYLSHVSNVLADLDDEGLAECLTPDRRKGRLWAPTENGEKLIADLER